MFRRGHGFGLQNGAGDSIFSQKTIIINSNILVRKKVSHSDGRELYKSRTRVDPGKGLGTDETPTTTLVLQKLCLFPVL